MRAVAMGSSALAGSSIRSTSGSTPGAGDEEALLLPSGERERAVPQAVLHLVQSAAWRRLFSTSSRNRPSLRSAAAPPPRCRRWTWWGTGWPAGTPSPRGAAGSPGPPGGRAGPGRPPAPSRLPRSGTSSCIRFRQRTKVLFPHPLGPMMGEHRIVRHCQRDVAERVVLLEPGVQLAHVDLRRAGLARLHRRLGRHRNLLRETSRPASESIPMRSSNTSAALHAWSCHSSYGLTA